MQKPYGYDEATIPGDFTPIELGGHRLVILGAKEATIAGKDGRLWDILAIQFDTDDEDKQPRYYRNRYEADKNLPNARYQGEINIFLPAGDPSTDAYIRATKQLKGFITAVERSNSGFVYNWGTADQRQLVGKRVGGNFGAEEYRSSRDNAVKTINKLRYFISLDYVDETDPPKLKELRENGQRNSSVQNDYFAGTDDTSLPFNL